MDIKIDKKRVLDTLGFKNHDEENINFGLLYNEFIKNIEPIYDYKLINTSDTFKKDICIEAGYTVLAICTLGDKINEIINKAFLDGRYMEGLIIDTISNIYIFEITDIMANEIRTIINEKGLKLSKKYNPGEDIDLNIQKLITEQLQVGVTANEYGLLSPMKSCSFLYFAGENIEEGITVHNCNECNMKNCIYRKIELFKLTIIDNGEERIIEAEKDSNLNLLDVLIENGYKVQNGCNKNGVCGRCRVRVNNESVLSCKTYIKSDMEIVLIDESYSILEDFKNKEIRKGIKTGFGIIIDLGSTTVVMALIELNSGDIVDKISFLNPQRAYGLDILMRINFAILGGREELAFVIKEEIYRNILFLLKRNNVGIEKIKDIIISGNTAMMHMFLEKDCKNISVYPYEVIEEIEGKYKFESLFTSDDFIADIYITPYLSGFVGGDITAGILYLNNYYKDYLFIDLGTNGEIVLKYNNRYYTTSTASGPAFEGVNIKCGIGSIDGAISKVKYKEKAFIIETIGNREAIGICGSGIIDLVSELIENKIIDKTGLLIDKYFEKGIMIESNNNIYFTQSDIRQVQLAKAAISAGIKVLMKEANINLDKIKHLILAGGFGNNINISSAKKIGLIPDIFDEKIVFMGNTSLAGSYNLLLEEGLKEKIEEIKGNLSYINLSDWDGFQGIYLDEMGFKVKEN